MNNSIIILCLSYLNFDIRTKIKQTQTNMSCWQAGKLNKPYKVENVNNEFKNKYKIQAINVHSFMTFVLIKLDITLANSSTLFNNNCLIRKQNYISYFIYKPHWKKLNKSRLTRGPVTT